MYEGQIRAEAGEEIRKNLAMLARIAPEEAERYERGEATLADLTVLVNHLPDSPAARNAQHIAERAWAHRA